MTTRANKLQQLAMSLPQENQQLAKGQQQARQIQLQEQIKQANPAAGPGLAQQLGAQHAQQAGQIQLGAQKQGQQQAQQVGQMGLEQQARQQRATGAQQQLSLSNEQRNTADRLSKLSSGLERQLLSDQLEFKRDQAGQTSFNERQLLDYAATQARSAEEFQEYVQSVQQIQERELQVLTSSYNKINQVLNQGYVKKGRALDTKFQKELAHKKRALEKAITDKQNKAANRAAMFQAGGAILGAGVGALVGGGPQGAAIGTSIGSGAGMSVAAATS